MLAAGFAVFAVLGVGGHMSAPMSTVSVAPMLTLSPVVVAAASARSRPERVRTIVGAGASAAVLVRDSGVPRLDPPDPWSSLTDPAFAASVSAGMPVWAAAALAAHAPTALGSPMKLTNLER